MIPTQLFHSIGSQVKTFAKDEIIFNENDSAKNYYQILSGAVKMSNFNDEGKEFIQGIFYKEQSFGEPPLFIDVKYPANAISLVETQLFIIPKNSFFQLLENNPDIHLNFTQTLAKRLYFKAIIASEISTREPTHRILRFLDYLKNDVHNITDSFGFEVPYTRQQIADTLGLRVETTIRAIKNLEKQGKVKIIKRKVFR